MIAENKEVIRLKSATVRFAGDSGDGMQLAGMQFTDTSAIFGNDIATLPDYPAEIRAPAGTVAGVSGFQINFSSEEIFTPGDQVNALIAMNPAALKANISAVEDGGVVIVNESEFEKTNLRKAGYPEGYNPLDDPKIKERYRIIPVPISRLTQESLATSGLGAKDVDRCKNMYALGLIYWYYDRPLETTIKYLTDYFEKKKNLPEVAKANILALRGGYNLGETAEIFPIRYQIERATISPGRYRRITGNEALAMGLVTASKLSGRQLVYCSYPITPASDILHTLAALKNYRVKTFQAEDEIAAVCSAIGASYAGQLGVTGTSGPGLALKGEGIGLAVMTELPLVIVDVQRGGPSTGLPTKTEQADLLQAVWGRNSECPAVVLAASSPSDCFTMAIEAVRIAFESMVPVLLLSDGYIGNGAEPWLIPDPKSLAPINVTTPSDPSTYKPYDRNDNLARPWAFPGMQGYEHRVGGLEKQNITGNVNYEPANHQLMINIRQEKVDRIADRIPALEVHGPKTGDVLVLGWGGTFGSILTATMNQIKKGRAVACANLRYMNPLPKNLGQILRNYKQVLVPELNLGQLRTMVRAKYLVDARGLNKVQGQPFLIEEIEQAIDLMVGGRWPQDTQALQPREGKVTV